MSFSSLVPAPIPGEETPTWQNDAQAGRLDEALVRLLETTPGDSAGAQLLEDLIGLRSHLRAKAWGRAESLATRLAPAASSLAPALETEVTFLKESGERLERGDAEGALERLKRVTLPLLLGEAETQRGTALVYLGEEAEAEAAFGRAVEADPRHYRALTNLGNVALEAGRTDEAIALYQRALRIDDTFANAHHNLGVAYRRQGNIHKSVQAIRKAQRTGRQRDRSDARDSLRRFAPRPGGRYGRWLMWGIGAAALYLVLKTLGVL